jgi:hypothetical protein
LGMIFVCFTTLSINNVEVLAIVSKASAENWLMEHGEKQ